jgi:hypothetical protein
VGEWVLHEECAVESTRSPTGAWQFQIDAEEVWHAPAVSALNEMLGSAATEVPADEVIQQLLELWRRLPQQCIESLVDMLCVLPAPDLKDREVPEFANVDLGQLSDAERAAITRQSQIRHLAIIICPDGSSSGRDSKPFFNATIEDPWGRCWDVGDGYIDFG